VYPALGKECFITGKCRNGFPISGKQVENQYDCRKDCQFDPSCNWFTYYKEARYCQLHRNCTKLDNQTCTDCLSGEKDCAAPEIKC